MRYKNKITLHYTNAKGEESDRELEPYKLLNYHGNWYLVAYCHTRESLATFLLARMEHPNIIDEEFDSLTENREVQQFIESSAGIYKSKNTTSATVRFYEPALYKVNHQVWHKDQTVEQGEVDGKKYIDFTIPVGWSYEEIMAKVMAYAPHSEVISPPEFKEEWKETIRQLHDKFIT
jgi:predicted DNA-binding transcriptional regulator YafY